MNKGMQLVDFGAKKDDSWDMDQWVACLNMIRRKFCETPELARHGLCGHVVVVGEGSEERPELAIVLPKSKYFGHFDVDSMVTVFEDWCRTHKLGDLLDEAPKYGVPTWEQLKTQRVYPIDERDL